MNEKYETMPSEDEMTEEAASQEERDLILADIAALTNQMQSNPTAQRAELMRYVITTLDLVGRVARLF